MPHSVLVTGATGFIGRRTVARLLDAGYRVWAAVREPQDIAGDGPRLTVVRWDLLDERGPSTSVRDVEVVVHLAARIPGREGPPAGSFAENVVMAANLLAQIGAPKHVVLASTLDVYGRPMSLPLREDHPTAPVTAYAASKLRCEQLFQDAGASRGFALTVLRLSQVYGPGDGSAKFIPTVIEAILEGRRPCLYGDGSDLRDYVYVEDVAQAIVLAVERRKAGTFNVSSGDPHSIAEVAGMLLEIAGVAGPPAVADRRGERVDLLLDIAKARRVLRYRPQMPLRDGLRRQYEWARSPHRDV